MRDLEDVLTKTGADLFRELLRLYPVAEAEDYHRLGSWREELIKTDLQLIWAHRKEAGASDPPPLEDVPMPKAPETNGELNFLRGQPLAMLTPILQVREQAQVASLRLIALFIAKNKLDPAKSKTLLTSLKAHEQAFVIKGFHTKAIGVEATDALEKYIEECKTNNAWGTAAAPGIVKPIALVTPSTVPVATATASTHPGMPNGTTAKVVETSERGVAMFIAKNKLDPRRAKALLMGMAETQRSGVFGNFVSDKSGIEATDDLEKYIETLPPAGAIESKAAEPMKPTAKLAASPLKGKVVAPPASAGVKNNGAITQVAAATASSAGSTPPIHEETPAEEEPPMAKFIADNLLDPIKAEKLLMALDVKKRRAVVEGFQSEPTGIDFTVQLEQHIRSVKAPPRVPAPRLAGPSAVPVLYPRGSAVANVAAPAATAVPRPATLANTPTHGGASASVASAPGTTVARPVGPGHWIQGPRVVIPPKRLISAVGNESDAPQLENSSKIPRVIRPQWHKAPGLDAAATSTVPASPLPPGPLIRNQAKASVPASPLTPGPVVRNQVQAPRIVVPPAWSGHRR